MRSGTFSQRSPLILKNSRSGCYPVTRIQKNRKSWEAIQWSPNRRECRVTKSFIHIGDVLRKGLICSNVTRMESVVKPLSHFCVVAKPFYLMRELRPNSLGAEG